jgi:tetratricopeptide (TPR) repeat protein
MRDRGDLPEAVKVGEAGLAPLLATHPVWTDAMVMLGATVLSAYRQWGAMGYARLFADRLIDAAERNGSPRARMAAYWNAAVVDDSVGDLPRAYRRIMRAYALLGEENDRRNLAILRATVGHIMLLAHPERAEEAFGILVRADADLAETSAGPVYAAYCLVDLSRACLMLDDPMAAVDVAERAVQLLGDNRGLPMAEVRMVLADAYLAQGRREGAIGVLIGAAALLDQAEATWEAARCWRRLSDLFGAAGEPAREDAARRSALDCAGIRRPH